MCLSLWEDVKYIQDPDRTLTFDLKVHVKFVGFMTWLFVRATAFLSFDSLIMFGTWVHHQGIMRRIHTWPWTSLYKFYFHHEFESGKIVFALWHKHTKFWHMFVLHEKTCCVHSWPLYDLDLWPICAGGILSEFYSVLSFYKSFCLKSPILQIHQPLTSVKDTNIKKGKGKRNNRTLELCVYSLFHNVFCLSSIF